MTPLERLKYKLLFLWFITIPITVFLYPNIVMLFGEPEIKAIEILPGISLPYSKTLFIFITITFALNLFPPAFYMYKSYQIKEAMFRNVAPLLRDSASLIKPGLTFPKLLEELSKKDYGPLSYYIRKVYMLTLSGYDFPEAFKRGMQGIPRNILRYLQVLVEAYLSGGKVAEVLDEASKYFLELYSFEEMRERTLKAYVYIVAMAIVVFLVSVTLILFFSETLMATGGKAPVIPILSKDEIIAILFYTSVVISIFGGLILGKIVKGEVLGGFLYIYVFMLISMVYLLFSDEIIKLLSVFLPKS